jgi:dTMP kinase
VTRGLLPDITFLLLLDPEVAAGRWAERDRLEREGVELQQRVDAAYRSLAARFPERIVTVNADRPPNVIRDEILEQFRQRS